MLSDTKGFTTALRTVFGWQTDLLDVVDVYGSLYSIANRRIAVVLSAEIFMVAATPLRYSEIDWHDLLIITLRLERQSAKSSTTLRRKRSSTGTYRILESYGRSRSYFLEGWRQPKLECRCLIGHWWNRPSCNRGGIWTRKRNVVGKSWNTVWKRSLVSGGDLQ